MFKKGDYVVSRYTGRGGVMASDDESLVQLVLWVQRGWRFYHISNLRRATEEEKSRIEKALAIQWMME